MTVRLQEESQSSALGRLGRTESKEVSWGPCRSPDSKWSKKSARDSSWWKGEREWPGHDYRWGELDGQGLRNGSKGGL